MILVKNKKQMFLVISVFILFIVLGTISYAFFNYTRTGSANTIRVGKIVFSAEQGTSFNLTNAFPIEATPTNLADNTKVGTVTIHVTGETDYSEGIEYLISSTDVVNVAGRRSLPITIDVSYEASNNETIGTLDTDYFDNNGGNTSLYKVLTKNVLKDNEKLVVGYIAKGNTGIDGTITIKAYIDEDKVAISDTYPENTSVYVVNSNMTDQEFNACVNYYINELDDVEQSATRICRGDKASIHTKTLQEVVNHGMIILSLTEKPDGMSQEDYNEYRSFYSQYIEDLLALNVIQEVDYQNGTTASWASNRMVLTTNEWNSLQQNGVSFKIKVEANEGTWVEGPPTLSDMCPNCVFGYPTETVYTTWNDENETPTDISSWSSDYHDAIANTSEEHFLGATRNSDNQAERLFACNVIDNEPVCLEVNASGSLSTHNRELISNIYDTDYMCKESSGNWGTNILCGLDEGVWYYDYGYAEMFGLESFCWADASGTAECEDY